MSYDSLTSDISRAPCTLVKLFPDSCELTWTVPPCTALHSYQAANIAVNGTFETDTDWTKGTGWTINTGPRQAECDGTQVAATRLSQTSTMVAGRNYLITFDYTRTAGGVGVTVLDSNDVGTIWELGDEIEDTKWGFFIESNDDYSLSTISQNDRGDVLLKTTNRGFSWTEIQTGLLATDTIKCFEWDGTDTWMFIYKSGTNYYSMTSDNDLTTFTTGVQIGSVNILDIATDGTDWHLCSANNTPARIYKSSNDGATWASYPVTGKNENLHGITYNGTVWCAVGDADGTEASIITFTDASVSISVISPVVPKNVNLNDVTSFGTMLIAVGDLDGVDAYIVTSPDDGVTWTEQANSRNYNLQGVDGSGPVVCAVGSDSGNNGNYIVTSPDGLTYTERLYEPAVTTVLWDVTYRDNSLIASGANSDQTACMFYHSESDNTSIYYSDASGSVSYEYQAINTGDDFAIEGDVDFIGTVDNVSIRENIEGVECYNTFYTCRSTADFSKASSTLKFTSADAAIPFNGVYPYVDSIRFLPTEIAEQKTVKGRVKVNMLDEPSTDIGIDPYYATRDSIQGEFWKKFVARNPNYKGRDIEIYEGYIGLDEADFEQRWIGKLDNITISRGKVTIDSIDTMSELDSITYPEKIKTELNANITDATASIVLTSLINEDGDQIATSGYIQIEDEIISYSGITVASNLLTGCVRGVFSTTTIAHDSGTRVTMVKYFAPTNPFTLLETIWDDAGGDYATEFDSTEWAKWQAWPKTDVNFSAIILDSDPVKASDAFWEIANILDLHIWQNEAQKITVRRNMGNDPDRTYTDITDRANIISKSGSVDYNEESRKTRVVHYWNKTARGEFDKSESYDKIDSERLESDEGTNGFNDISADEIFNRWISLRFLSAADAIPYIKSTNRHRILNRGFARPLIKVSVELKDEGIKTGDSVLLSTDERLDINGNSIATNHLVVKRDKQRNKIVLTLKELPKRRICIIAPAGTPGYSSATAAQKEYGFIASGKDGLMPNGDPGYYIW